jgi:ComF family protein
LCEQPLRNVSRVPVCLSCLQEPKPLQAEFFCRSCRTAFVSSFSLDEKGYCAVCRESLVNFDAAYSFGAYEGSLRKLIHLFKYGKVESLAEPLSKFLLLATPLEAQFDVVIAMPMHWRKQWERGFNQARLLAEPIARRYGLKVSDSLRRTRYTKAQAGLSEAQRRDNLKNSFRVERRDQVAGKRVLLVDDVFTTGATLRAAAEVLKAAGASHVTALTLARVDHYWPEAGRRSLESLRQKTGFAPSRENAEVEISAGRGVQ